MSSEFQTTTFGNILFGGIGEGGWRTRTSWPGSPARPKISPWFITNGLYRAIGSLSGLPAMSSTRDAAGLLKVTPSPPLLSRIAMRCTGTSVPPTVTLPR